MSRLLQQFFEAFGIVERSGMRSDPFELWQALYRSSSATTCCASSAGPGVSSPYRTDTERQYLTAVAQGEHA